MIPLQALMDDTYQQLVPEPRTPEMQNLNFDDFYLQPLPKHYVYFTEDLTM